MFGDNESVVNSFTVLYHIPSCTRGIQHSHSNAYKKQLHQSMLASTFFLVLIIQLIFSASTGPMPQTGTLFSAYSSGKETQQILMISHLSTQQIASSKVGE